MSTKKSGRARVPTFRHPQPVIGLTASLPPVPVLGLPTNSGLRRTQPKRSPRTVSRTVFLRHPSIYKRPATPQQHRNPGRFISSRRKALNTPREVRLARPWRSFPSGPVFTQDGVDRRQGHVGQGGCDRGGCAASVGEVEDGLVGGGHDL